MELIVQILMLFIGINCILKLSFWRWWQAVIFGIVCGVFIGLVYPYSIRQSKTQITDYLLNTQVMQDAAVLVTLEASVCFAYCFLISKKLFGGELSRWGKVLHWYAGLLIFPVLFWVLTQTIFALPGIKFEVIACVLAVAVALLLPVARYLIIWLIPEAPFRMETHFLTSLFVCIIGLITTVNGNVVYSAVEEPFNWRAFVTSLLLLAWFFSVGVYWNKWKWIFRQRKKTVSKK